jgi:MFS family permease
VIALAVTLACTVMAFAQSALTLMLGFAVLRGSAVGALSLVSQHVINLWFVHRRGMAAAAVSLGYALGGMVFPPVVDRLMRAVAWRYTYAGRGVLVGATMLPVGLLVFRSRPGSALHVMLFLENPLRTLFIFNGFQGRYCQ